MSHKLQSGGIRLIILFATVIEVVNCNENQTITETNEDQKPAATNSLPEFASAQNDEHYKPFEFPTKEGNETEIQERDYGYGHEKCYTTYKTVYKTVYETKYKKKCHTTYDKKCHTIYETSYKKKCSTSYTKKCHTSYKTVYNKKCKTHYEQKVSINNIRHV